MVLGKNKWTRTRILMEGCDWLYFCELVTYHSLLMMFKIVKFKTPVTLCNKFEFDRPHIQS